MHVGLVIPGEAQLAVLHGADDLQQVRAAVGRVVVLAEGTVRAPVQAPAALVAGIELAQVVERDLRAGPAARRSRAAGGPR